MLTELRIRHLALLEEVDLCLEPGFNVLTGETGAGKSMLVQAVQVLLGARAGEELIRSGADAAVVEARFWVSPERAEALGDYAPGEPPGWARDEEVVLRRVVARGGRSRGYLNDQGVTLKTLAAVGRHLLSLSGQHEYQTFLAPENHLAILDAFGGLKEEAARFRHDYLEWRRLREERQALAARQQALAAWRELAEFQLQELEQAQLRPGEEEELLAARERLRHGTQLWEAAQTAYGRLYADSGAVLGKLAEVRKALAVIAALEPAWQGRLAELEELSLRLEDLALAARDYRHQVRLDPERLQDIEERLSVLNRLKRKYGGSLAAALELRERLRRELAAGENLEAAKAVLEEKLAESARRLGEAAMALSAGRRAAAPRLAAAVEAELHQVAMPRARFVVQWAPSPASAGELATPRGEAITEDGADRLEFYLAPNPGEPPKPLARIASGGELSRLVLVLKNLLALEGGADTLIFDEVDAGVGGGGVASTIGRKLRQLGDRGQVICITHLPQIACWASSHFVVEKQVQGERTLTRVRKLGQEERLREVARLLAGTALTPAALAQAGELLKAAQSGG
jgi:DNA repair protein RecN (Recombination protein N)